MEDRVKSEKSERWSCIRWWIEGFSYSGHEMLLTSISFFILSVSCISFSGKYKCKTQGIRFFFVSFKCLRMDESSFRHAKDAPPFFIHPNILQRLLSLRFFPKGERSSHERRSRKRKLVDESDNQQLQLRFLRRSAATTINYRGSLEGGLKGSL